MKNLDCIERLKSSPVFAMSLGSKELFHSNFWAWIMENLDTNHEFLRLFFPTLSSYSNIEREQKHRDITVWNDGKAYVIENKYKSIPSYKQLDDYGKELGKQFAYGVLTGIDKPKWELPAKWSFVSYADIAESIQQVSVNVIDESSKKYLQDYCSMLNSLNELLNCYSKAVGDTLPMWRKDELHREIYELRLWDLCQKHQEQVVLNKIENSVEFKSLFKKLEEYGIKYGSGCWFNRGKYTLDFRLRKNDGKRNRVSFCVQIEDNQYRVGVDMLFDAAKKENAEVVFNNEKLKDWFNKNKTKNDGIAHSANLIKSSMAKSYCSYKGEGEIIEEKQMYYSFAYQYWDITNNSFEAIYQDVIADLNKAFDILKDY